MIYVNQLVEGVMALLMVYIQTKIDNLADRVFHSIAKGV